ncbi:MAG TPA: aldehyde dehydrogenase family protein [Acidimicrobiales bacterium]|nr:aldehyde dehydrogenase family protein [Acidimicrobiales bacterium]
MADLVEAHGPFLDGRFVAAEGATFAVDDPATEQVVTEVRGASVAQVEQAIMAARRAFDEGPWPTLAVGERVAAMHRFAAALEARRDILIETVIAETGCPRTVTERAQIDMALESARQLPDIYASLPEWEHNELPMSEYLAGGKVRLSLRRYEPVGVVAAISPYNFPFVTNVWKVVPALVTGCTVILRPSPLTPLEALVLGEAAAEAGLPPGVFNVVVESGAAGGELLSSHRAVDLVSFTGSTTVGRAIAAQAAPTMKRLILELGGKSVQLHLPDVLEDSPESAARSAMSVFASHAGQGCSLQTRVLVPMQHKAAVLDVLAGAVPAIKVGDPRQRTTVVGPVISAAHRDRISKLVNEGVSAGGRIVAGGTTVDMPPTGWFYPPTVLDIDDNANPVAQREVFGPVVTVQGYHDLDQAVVIANDTEYGLSNGIYTDDLVTGERLAGRLRSGTVQVNQGAASAYTTMGGYKQSGIGRERGVPGLRAFQEIKHVVIGNR